MPARSQVRRFRRGLGRQARKRNLRIMPHADALAKIARQVDELVIQPGNMACARTLAESALADSEVGHVGALQLPTHPTEFDRADEETVLKPGQTVLVMGALHAVFCHNVEHVLPCGEFIFDATGKVKEATNAAFRRDSRWNGILGAVRNLGDFAAPWLELQLRRLERSLAPNTTARGAPALNPATSNGVPTHRPDEE